MSENQTKDSKNSASVSIRVVGVSAIVVAILLAFFAFAQAGYISDAETAVIDGEARYVECRAAIDSLQTASDYLTSQARMFVVTGRREFMDAYVYEYSVNNRRGKAVDTLRANFSSNQEIVDELEQALSASNGLAKTEFAAMRLAAEYYELEDVPSEVATANISFFRSLPEKDKRIDAARSIVLDDNYEQSKKSIAANVRASSDALLTQLNTDLEESKTLLQGLLFQLRIAVALLLCVILVFVLALFMYVLKPLGRYVERLSADEPLEPDGAYELHYLADAYNTIYEDNTKRIEQLRAYAERDPLTGISNRVGYDSFLATHTRNIALLLLDIDSFKEFNSVYGRDTGDAVLIKLAEALSTAFRSTDFPCRLEGDRFAVIMTNMNTELRSAILTKVDLVHSIISDDSGDLPAVTFSVGAAFSTEGMSDKEIYQAASSALRQAKQSRPGDVVFYGEAVVVEE